MKRITGLLAISAALALGSVSSAQMPGRQGGPGMPGGPGAGRGGPVGQSPAEMLLSHTGDLKLTDAQVARLAGVARRSAERRTSMRATTDSMRMTMPRPRPVPGEDAARFAPSPAFTSMMNKMRQAEHEDLRDALAVLNPDQQATAWEMKARRGDGQRPMRGGSGMVRGTRRGTPMQGRTPRRPAT